MSYSYNRTSAAPRETFKILNVESPRPGTWLVEIDGCTSALTARVYDNGDGNLWVRPTSGWEVRRYDRPTEKETAAILKAVGAYNNRHPSG